MDSQENALLQQSTLDPAKKAYATKQEVLERVKEIAHSAEVPNKEELDMLKTIFYKIHLAERDAQTKEYLAAGGDPEKSCQSDDAGKAPHCCAGGKCHGR